MLPALARLLVRTNNVTNADFLAELAKLLPPSIIQKIDMKLVAWIIDVDRRQSRGTDNRERLVIGGIRRST